MRFVVRALVAVAGALTLHAEELGWKLTPPVTVEKATLIWNGGSVAVILRGNAGERRYVHFMTPEAPPEKGGGELSFRYEKVADQIRIERGSKEETRLLELLRAACAHTFGTSDYAILNGEKDGVIKNRGELTAFSMGSLLRNFDRNIKKPNKAQK